MFGQRIGEVGTGHHFGDLQRGDFDTFQTTHQRLTIHHLIILQAHSHRHAGNGCPTSDTDISIDKPRTLYTRDCTRRDLDSGMIKIGHAFPSPIEPHV